MNYPQMVYKAKPEEYKAQLEANHKAGQPIIDKMTREITEAQVAQATAEHLPRLLASKPLPKYLPRSERTGWSRSLVAMECPPSQPQRNKIKGCAHEELSEVGDPCKARGSG